MVPQTRGRRGRISYAEESESQDDEEVDEVFPMPPAQQGDDSGGESDYEQGRPQKRRRKVKRRRRDLQRMLEEAAVPAEISGQDTESEDDFKDFRSFPSREICQPQVTPATVTLHLPVHLQNTKISINLHEILALDPRTRSHIGINADGSFTTTKNKLHSQCLISTLPAEIRVRILRSLLVTKEPIDFTARKGFSRSAQVLSISRAFHDDGTRVLYGENCFHFERATVRRGRYLDAEWKEIGYKDIRRFLRDIGENKKKLRYISFECIDAATLDTPWLTLAQRKFVNDGVLMDCFHMIANNTILDRFAIGTHGRAMVSDHDWLFLRALVSIKCYDLTFTKWLGDYKIAQDLMDKIRGIMEIEDEERDLTRRRLRVRMPFERDRRTFEAATW